MMLSLISFGLLLLIPLQQARGGESRSYRVINSLSPGTHIVTYPVAEEYATIIVDTSLKADAATQVALSRPAERLA